MLRLQLQLRLLLLDAPLEREGATVRAVASKPVLYFTMTFTSFSPVFVSYCLSAFLSILSTSIYMQFFACNPTCFKP